MDKIREAFYNTFDLKALELSNCSFKNISFGYDVGTDVCPATEDETHTCEQCEFSKITYKFYPELTDTRLLQLIHIMATVYGVMPNIRLGKDASLEYLKYHILKEVLKAYALLDETWKYKFYNKVRRIFLTNS